MSASVSHPHIDMPTEDQIHEHLQEKSESLQEIYLKTHQLVLETLPDVKYSLDCKDGGMGYGARQYGYDGWGLGALMAHTKWVSLVFFRGTDISDPEGILEGTGKRLRHVKLRSVEVFEARKAALASMLKEASELNDA